MRRSAPEPSVRPGLVLVDAPPAPLWLRVLLPLVVVGAAFFTFLPALDGKFLNWDDDKVIVDNSFIRDFDWHTVNWAFHHDKMGHYHPLTWLSYAAESEIGKWRYDDLSADAQARYHRDLDPELFHFTNLVLHAGVALGVYFLALLLLRAFLPPPSDRRDVFTPIAAALAALLFACHPLRVETVAWATERRDVLSSVFLVPSLIFYLKYAVHRGEFGAKAVYYVASVALLGVSLLGKAWGITLPAVMLLLDIYPLRRLGGKAGWLSKSAVTCLVEKTPFFVLAALFAKWARQAQDNQFYTAKTLEEWSVGDRIAQAFYGLKFYAYKTLAPFHLTPIVELPVRDVPGAPKYLLLTPPFLLAAVLVIGAVIVLFLLRRKWPAGIVAALCYAGIVSPVLGVHQSGPQLVADRYSYLSCMAWAIAGGAGLLWLYRRKSAIAWARAAFVPACGLSVGVVAVLCAMTWRQTEVWHDSWSLWRYASDVDPDCAMANTNVGLLYRKAGDIEKAVAYYERGLKIDPNNEILLNNIAVAWENDESRPEQERLEKALEYKLRAVKLKPKYADLHVSVGRTLQDLGRFDEAITHFVIATRYKAKYVVAFRRLGECYRKKAIAEDNDPESFKKSQGFYRKTLELESELDPTSKYVINALDRLGWLANMLKKYDEAETYYKQVLEIDPDNTGALKALKVVRANMALQQ